MKRIPILLFAFWMFSFTGCEQLLMILEGASGTVNTTPTQGEIIQGLKQALAEGTTRAATGLSKEGGFFNDPTVFIPFPPEAQFVAEKLQQLGLGNLVTDFVAKLNEGAEKGAKEAAPIFKQAITGMSIADASNILLGKDKRAATTYFETNTRVALFNAFSPKIRDVLEQVNAAQIWEQLTTRYNQIPFVSKKVETDIVKYATDKALDGLFLKLSLEEEKIREDPLARTTDILKKVFGYAAEQG
ncbi:MAG: DUF4197 domain-containing protein [Bacteroidia bacterium]|nr:DUF4197 domain-containing protein [Bacteroidia bacterium]